MPLKSLLIAPGERSDLIVDFSGHGGEQLVVSNDAFTVMQFRVAKTAATDTGSFLAVEPATSDQNCRIGGGQQSDPDPGRER